MTISERWAKKSLDEQIKIMAAEISKSDGQPYEQVKEELMKDKKKAKELADNIGQFMKEADAKAASDGGDKKANAEAEIIRKSQIYDTDAFFVFSLILSKALNGKFENNLFLTDDMVKDKDDAIKRIAAESPKNDYIRVWDFTKHDFPILDYKQGGKLDLHIIKLLFAFSKLLTAQSEVNFGKGKDFATLGVAHEVADAKGEKIKVDDKYILKGKMPKKGGKKGEMETFTQKAPYPYLAIHGEITDVLQKFYKKKMSASEKEAYKEAYQILINSYACFFKEGDDGTPSFYLTRIFEQTRFEIKVDKKKGGTTVIRTLECSPALLNYANAFGKQYLKIRSEFTETFKGVKSLSDFHMWAYMLTDAIMDARVRKYKWPKEKSRMWEELKDVAMTNAGENYAANYKGKEIDKRIIHALDFCKESGIIKGYSIRKVGRKTFVDYTPNRSYFKDAK